MGILDWIGPTSLTKRKRGWDALPVVPEQKSSWLIDDYRAALTVNTLIHGPGATDLLGGGRGNDHNSAVFACLQAIATAVAEPPLRVYRLKAGDRSELNDTPLGALLDHPNPHMTLSALLAYLSNCLHVDGNAYWRKLRAGDPETGNVVELWPISPSRLEPRTTRDSGDFISFYRYYVRPGQYEDISPTNIVHFRMGLDDADHRVGSGPLKRLARETSSDDQATRYADRLLANLAINGLSLEFDKDAPAVNQATADELKARIQAAYGGDNIGATSVLSPGAKLVSHGFSPEQMTLDILHKVPEERISAVLGVPAIVAGLGAGLARSTFANFKEAREAFTEMKLVPFWSSIGDTLTMSLVPDFMSERGVSVAFDIDDVRALQDDQNAMAVRLKTYVDAGILDVDEARAEIGHEPRKVLPAPKPLRALPAAASRRIGERKSQESIIRELQALHADLEPDWIEAAVKGLTSSAQRIRSRLNAGATSADDLVPEVEASLLGKQLEPLQLSLLNEVHALTVAELGIAFDLDDAATREYLQSAGSQIGGITDHTRERVRAALIEGQAAGEGIPELAARLRDLPAFGEARATVVARTELGHSQIEAAYQNYAASGLVVGVRQHDGDFDAACAARNGTVLTMAQAAGSPRLLHPNCTAAWAPIVDAAELRGSA